LCITYIQNVIEYGLKCKWKESHIVFVFIGSAGIKKNKSVVNNKSILDYHDYTMLGLRYLHTLRSF